MRFTALLIAITLIGGSCGESTALWAREPVPRFGVFIYSDLCLERESGDHSGYRITLIREGGGDRLEFEWSEGPLYGGLGYGVKLGPETSRMTFSVNMNPDGGPENFEDYSAELSDAELVLHVPRPISSGRPEYVYHLPRVRDLSRKLGYCNP